MTKRLRILHLEDNATDAELVRSKLEVQGVDCTLSRVRTSTEFQAALDQNDFDLIISDFTLPQFDGLSALKMARQRRPATPFLFVSGTIGEESAVESLKQGATDYVLKDRLTRLAASVERAVREAKERAERAQAQETLRMQAQVLESMSEGVLVIDDRGVIQYANPAAERMFGYTHGELQGRMLSEMNKLSVAENQQLVSQVLDQIVQQGHWTGEFENRKKGRDTSFFTRAHISQLNFGGKTYSISVQTDITERKRREQQLATQYAATRVLAESTTLEETTRRLLKVICEHLVWDVGELWLVDKVAKVLRCVEVWQTPSSEFIEFMALSKQMTFAQGVGLPGRVWESGRPLWLRDATQETNFPRRLMAHGAIGFPVLHRSEVVGMMEFFSRRIREPDAGLLQMFAILTDEVGLFLNRLQLEAQLRQAQKMEAIGQLAGGMAHDFNNILTVIQGYTQSLLVKEDQDKETVEGLKQTYLAAERAGNLTRQLLAFSRKQVIRPEPLNLNDVIGNLARMLGRLIGEDVTLRSSFALQLPLVQADAGQMEQVLMNLVVNARDAMPKGGELFITTERVTVSEAEARQEREGRAGEFVGVSVRDTGSGIAPENVQHIFEPFFTTKGKGTGLGLATAYGIVKQHQGWIKVASQIGEGTTFQILLPITVAPAKALKGAPSAQKLRGGTETILLVEDELALRKLIVNLLQRYGYTVLEATSGTKALDVWRQQGRNIDLLLTDMVMPDGVTGRDLAEKLKAENPKLKVILSSGYSADVARTDLASVKGMFFLQKPYHPEQLVQTIRECLDGGAKA